MPLRYEAYRIKEGDDAVAELWNRVFRDLDLRMAAQEDRAASFAVERDKFVEAALNRLDEIMAPVVDRLQDYASLGALLTARSADSIEVSTGIKIFVVNEEDREKFAPSGYLSMIKEGDPGNAMLGTLVTYDPQSGNLTVDVDRFAGSGFHENWIISAASATDNAEAVGIVDGHRIAAEAAAAQALTRRNEAAASSDAALGYKNTAEAEAAAADDARVQAQVAQAATELARNQALTYMEGFLGTFLSTAVPTTRQDASALQVGDWGFKRVIGTPDTYFIDYVASTGPVVWRSLTAAADTSVTSFNGRTGGVNPVSGDYTATLITLTAITGLTGANVQAVLESVKTALDAKAPNSRTISTSGLASGGGDLSANRTIDVPVASQAEAEAGVISTKAMTPERTKQAILALAPSPGAASETAAGLVELATSAETVTGTDTARATHAAGVKAAIDAAIAALVASAPGVLNTLDELAAALGDDPNFATTITTALGTKLNSSAYTAADVLSKLTGVDGAGSGLDADLLDGQQGSFYQNAGNLNAGTVPDARLPGRLQEVATTITDWNNATLNGVYMASGAANGPTVGWYIGTVENHGAAGWRTQTVHDFTTAASTDGRRWRRHQTNGTWGAWYRIRDAEAELDTLYAKITTSISPGTGLSGGGNLSASRTLSFDTAWGDARYPVISGAATAANYRANSGGSYLTPAVVWSAMAEVALTDAATIAVDLSTGFDFTVTLAASRTLGFPTNLTVGKRGRIRVVQPAGGACTLSFAAGYVFSGGTVPTIDTGANRESYLDYDVVAAGKVRLACSPGTR